MKTKIIRIDSKKPEIKRLRLAVKVIKNGGLVVFPTETVYGIGADAFNPDACSKIFAAKNRPADNPLIVHVSSMDMAKEIAKVPKRYEKPIKELWPGPITFVLEKKNCLPDTVTAGLKTVAVRYPDNKIAVELIRLSHVPIAAPSANISKRPSGTEVKHVIKDFSGKVEMIIDGGKTTNGLESTILDLKTFTLLRPGAMTVELIERTFHKRVKISMEARGVKEAKTALSPGMKYKHYAPNKPLFLFEGEKKDLKKIISKFSGHKITVIATDETCDYLKNGSEIRLGKAGDLKMIASNLFSALRKLDDLKTDFGIVESFKESGIGLAIMNRLRKATGHTSFTNRKELDRILQDVTTTA